MHTVKFVYWEEDGAWIGYLQDYPIIGRRGRAWTTSRTICEICIIT
jgi:hypothetical protein